MKKSMLFTTIAMIVVVVVALSTATFAWFTASTMSAIDGEMGIEATSDFLFRTVNVDAWEPTTNKIDLGVTGGDKGIMPVSPYNEIKATNYVKPGNTQEDIVIDDTTKQDWFSVVKVEDSTKPTQKWDTLAKCEDGIGYKIASFQVGMPQAEVGGTNGNLTILISNLAGIGEYEFNSVKAVRVVLAVTTYADVATTAFYGTDYLYGGEAKTSPESTNGFFTNNNTAPNVTLDTETDTSPKDNVLDYKLRDVVGQATKDSSSLQKMLSQSNTDYSFKNVLTDAKASVEDSRTEANKDGQSSDKNHPGVYIVNEGGNAGKANGVYREINQVLSFKKGEFKTVTAYVWLDGWDTSNGIQSQKVSVKVDFTK